MVPSPGSPFYVCQDREGREGGREGGRIAICWSRLQLELEETCVLHTHVCVTGSPGLKMPYGGTSHNINHLIAWAEMEMSCFIRAHQYCTIYISGNAVKLRTWWKSEAEVWDASRHLLHVSVRYRHQPVHVMYGCTFSPQNHLHLSELKASIFY